MGHYGIVLCYHLTYSIATLAWPLPASSSPLLEWNTHINVTSLPSFISHSDQSIFSSSRAQSLGHYNMTENNAILSTATLTSSQDSLDNAIENIPQQISPNPMTRTDSGNNPEPGSAIGSLHSNNIEIMRQTSSNLNHSDISMMPDDINTGVSMSHDINLREEKSNLSSLTKDLAGPLTDSVNQTETSQQRKINVEAISNNYNLQTQSFVTSTSDIIPKQNAISQNERYLSEQNFDFQTPISFKPTPKAKRIKVSAGDNTVTPDYKEHTHVKHVEKTQVTTVEDVDNSWNSTQLTITLYNYKDSVTAYWTFQSNDTRITGFLVTYRINKREHFDSSKLGKNVRAFTLHSLHEDEDYVICVHAMVNITVVKEACAHWNENSMKILVGIMAGILFLIPCIVVVILILIKDRKVRKKKECIQLNYETRHKDKLMDSLMERHDPAADQVKSTHQHTTACILKPKSCTEEHTDSEDELWKRQSQVGQLLVNKDTKLMNQTFQKEVK